MKSFILRKGVFFIPFGLVSLLFSWPKADSGKGRSDPWFRPRRQSVMGGRGGCFRIGGGL